MKRHNKIASITDTQTEKNSDREPPWNDHRTYCGVSGMGLKLVLLDRNLALNTDTAQNYKYMYMFGRRMVFF